MIEYLADIKQLTTDFLTEIRDELVAYLAANNRNATGKSSASIQVANVTDNGGQVVGGKWIRWVFEGRGAGGMPPISVIIDWLNAKGLPRGMAWNVAKKIAREGTELFKRGEKPLNDILTQERINEFSKNIANTIAVEISSNITQTFA